MSSEAGLDRVGALIVAEPTGNKPLVGHKGALWLEAETKGITAHGSMPEKGINAIYKAAHAVAALQEFDFNVARHGVLGAPTLNVGTIQGGLNINSVPDRALIGIDIRTIPAQNHGQIREQLSSYLGPEVALKTLLDARSVWTDPAILGSAEVIRVAREVERVDDTIRSRALLYGCVRADGGARITTDRYHRTGRTGTCPSDRRILPGITH